MFELVLYTGQPCSPILSEVFETEHPTSGRCICVIKSTPDSLSGNLDGVDDAGQAARRTTTRKKFIVWRTGISYGL